MSPNFLGVLAELAYHSARVAEFYIASPPILIERGVTLEGTRRSPRLVAV